MDIRLMPAGEVSPSALDELAEVLLDAVAGGAVLGFFASLTGREARDWWAEVMRDPSAFTWVVREDERIVGVVRLLSSSYPAGGHRAEVSKFLVLGAARGRGYGRALMATLEAEASAQGRRLLMLDTCSESPAEGMYRRWGWQVYGTLEGHAAAPDGRLTTTTFMIKRL